MDAAAVEGAIELTRRFETRAHEADDVGPRR